ncbi:Uncharacterised protein [Vibrio cholerae]|nr:Uncharacterised protein [Vibrio cholerae]CRZ86550.1 Uncharacterised protein [Vibrio cholerae]CSA36217.1 Uncharacterised protein [Vibrio cholerae]CSB35076.1 Uncharacterised protein [Vibrio cholerae]CSB52441.1 Uncharacterised protein [Vibrio cholerae]
MGCFINRLQQVVHKAERIVIAIINAVPPQIRLVGKPLRGHGGFAIAGGGTKQHQFITGGVLQ